MGFRSKIIKTIASVLGAPVTFPDDHVAPTQFDIVEDESENQGAVKPEDFTDRLKEVLNESSSHSLGGLQIIGLSGIRTHFGEKWPRTKDKVFNIARQAIEENLEKHDIYATFYDIYFVIFFGDLTIENAEMKCTLIAKKISNKLFGDSSQINLIDINTASLDKKGDVDLRAINFEPDLEDIIHAKNATYLKEVTLPSEDGKVCADSTAEKENPVVDTMDWIAIQKREQGQVAYISKEEKAEMIRLQLPPREQKLYDFGKLNFAFRPMWLVAQQVTSAMSCIPMRVTSEGTVRVGGPALLSSPESSVNAEYDIATVNKILSELQELEAHGHSAVFIAPVHFITIVRKKLSKPYLKTIRAIPERFRRKILFELMGIPSGTPNAAIMDVVSILRLVVDNLLIRVRLEDQNLSRFMGLRVYAVGADVTNFPIPESQLITLIDGFASRSKALGFKTYIHGLRSRSLVSAAVCAGIDFIDGDPVISVLSKPQENSHFNLDELYNSEPDNR